MQPRWLITACFALLVVQAAFAGPCTQGPNVSDGVNGDVLTTFSCTFVPSGAPTTVFNLTSYITDGGTLTAYAYENWLTPGYLVFTNDPGNLSDTAAWVDVLYFVPDEIADSSVGGGFDGSDTVDLYTGTAMPSYATVNNFGNNNFGTGVEAAGGTFVESAGSDVHSFAIGSAVPEPSTFLLVISAGLGLLAIRRRLA